ncbi:flavin reductase family protein [Streptomyces pathocidini]|uniref:Flavin reductase family protein n=1 Tax=Streptomyces pathocidini TaxID=1650571 RepID=A0ABW7UQ59_9ACTN|nr:flavin reductase family protein [Streptomyces pathocidini]
MTATHDRGTQPRPVTENPAATDLFRSAFRRHAAGVAVITAHGVRPAGLTATSLASVAAEPPLLSFGIGTGSSSWPVFADAEHVGVHILDERQRELAATFARSGADRFAPPTRWRRGPYGVPVLEGVQAWLVCRVAARIPAGDHRLVLAEVLTGGAGGVLAGDAEGWDADGSGRPLLYHQGRFTALRD